MADATVGVLKAVLAADTADFTRKMATATDDVRKLAEKLQNDMEPRQRAVNAAVRDFLGGTEIRRAQEYAQAVEKIGGANVLTAADQGKVNKAVSEALEHYRKLGIEGPANLVKLEAETRRAEQSTGLLDAQWAKMTAAFSASTLIDRAVSGLISFGKAAIEDAGRVVDLADKTGLSTRAVQVYGQAVKEAGGTVEDVANAVFKLGINLDKGGKEATSALGALGLSLKQVQDLKPEDQFELIADRLSKVSSAQERNRLGVELFGKTWGQVAPAVVAGIGDIADKMTIMGDEQVRALDAAADAWDRFWEDLKRQSAATLGQVVIDIKSAMSGFEKFRNDIQVTAAGAIAGLVTGEGPIKTAIGAHNAYIDSLHAKAAAEAETDKQSKKTREEAERLAKAQEEAAKKAEQWQREVQSLASQLSGANIDREIKKMAAAVSSLKGEIDAGALPKLLEQLDDWYVSGRKLPPVLEDIRVANDAMAKSVQSLNDSLQSVFDQNRFNLSDLTNVADVDWGSLSGVIKKKIVLAPQMTGEEEMQAYLDRLAGRFGHLSKMAQDTADDSSDAWKQSLSETARGFEQLANIAGGEMGAVARGIGIAVSGLDSMVKGLDAVKAATSVLGSLTGVLGVVNGVLAIGKAIGGLFKGGEGAKVNDLRDEFKAKFGDAAGAGLQAIIDKWDDPALNAAYARLLRTGKMDEFKQAAADLEQRLGELQNQAVKTDDAVRHIGESGKSWQELQSLAQQFGIDISRLGTAFEQAKIDDIGKEYADAFRELTAAGADVTAVLEGMQDEVNDWLHEAMKAGSEIPESMRPILQALADAGMLTDEAGDKITDLSKLHFAPTLEKGIDNLTTAVYDLVDVLGGEVPAAFRRMAAEAGRAVDETQAQLDSLRAPNLDLSYQLPSYDGPSPDAGDAYGFAYGSRGLRAFNPAGEWVQLHGNEEVLTAPQSMGVASMVRDAIAAAAGDGSFKGNVYLDSRLVGRGMFMPIVREAARQQVTQK